VLYGICGSTTAHSGDSWGGGGDIIRKGRTRADDMCSEMPTVTYVEFKQQIDLCTWNNTRFSTHEIASQMNASWRETVQEGLKDQPKTYHSD
jgi:hypothetical protein